MRFGRRMGVVGVVGVVGVIGSNRSLRILPTLPKFLKFLKFPTILISPFLLLLYSLSDLSALPSLQLPIQKKESNSILLSFLANFAF